MKNVDTNKIRFKALRERLALWENRFKRCCWHGDIDGRKHAMGKLQAIYTILSEFEGRNKVLPSSINR